MRLQVKLLFGVVTGSVLGLLLYHLLLTHDHSNRALRGQQTQVIATAFADSDSSGKEGEEKNALSSKVQQLQRQRVALSRYLNEAKRAQGQAACDYLYLQKSIHPEKFLDVHAMPVSRTGGWCLEEGKSSNAEHKMDPGVLPALSAFLAGKSVASFGDGPGDYRKAILGLGKVKKYDAFDGAPFCEETSEGQVRFLDLTGPQYGLDLYDWVLSLEVAEHIPAKFEAVYVDNLVRHAREGILLSWALPEQDGIHHVNGQTLAHVKAVMEQRGFVLDEEAGVPLRQAATFSWLRSNMQVYRRLDPASADPSEA